MRRYLKRLLAGGAALALTLVLTGCGGDGKKVEPKAAGDAPNVDAKGQGGKGGAKGNAE